jgi:hypothetical protein
MKVLKYFTLFCSLIISLSNAFGQETSNDFQRLKLAAVIIPQAVSIPIEASTLLINKMNQIVSDNGMTGNTNSARFIITPNVAVLTKEITGGAPMLHTLQLELTFYIGDGISGTKFSNTSLMSTGVGTSESKAYIDAIKRINSKDENIRKALEIGKLKIIDYYAKNCDIIINKAIASANSQRFDEAIYELTSIPDACEVCYNKALDKATTIFKSKIDFECKVLLNEATNVWSNSQDNYGAQQASNYLSQINPNSSCYKDAVALNDKIALRIRELNQREWQFMLKKQQDAVDIEKAYIKAVRDVGVAYGENQPQSITTTYNVIGWW